MSALQSLMNRVLSDNSQQQLLLTQGTATEEATAALGTAAHTLDRCVFDRSSLHSATRTAVARVLHDHMHRLLCCCCTAASSASTAHCYYQR
jgi:hypothetical protein